MPAHQSAVRWRIISLLFLISVVTYMDRVNIAVAGKMIMPDLGITPVQFGLVLSAFGLGYALFQIPGGWLADRVGPRKTLAFALAGWSAFTAMIAVSGGSRHSSWPAAFGSLLLLRFLIGAGEAAALPNFGRTAANWLPRSERGRGMGIAIGGIGIGSALTPPLVAGLMSRVGWRPVFAFCGGLGFAVAWVWYLLARDTPNEHPGVSPGERAWIAESGVSRDAEPEPPSSLWHLLKNRVVWYLIMSYLMLGYVAYIYLAWFYIYLVDVRHFTLLTGSYVAAAPFVAMAITCPLGGWLTDRICRRYGARAGRSGIGLTGMISTALFLSLGAVTPDPYLSVAELSLGAGTLYLTVGAYWSGAIALSNKNSGALTGLMNMGANIGGTLSPTFTPWLGTKLGWPFALLFAAGVAGLGGILWFGIRTPD